jgi:hypothetical protein
MAMDKNEKEKLSRYGKLSCDFANGKTTDDILISFFNNLQAAFNFSKDFPKKALTFYPTKQMTISSLSNNEQNLFEILLKRNKILESCNNAINRYSVTLDKYDSIALMFTVVEVHWAPGEEMDAVEDVLLIPENKITSYIDSLIQEKWADDVNKEIKQLIKLCHRIEDIKPESINRFAEIEKIAKDYKNISRLHDYVNETHKKLKDILSQIIEADKAYEAKGFNSILKRYNRRHKKMLIINEDDDSLVEIETLFERNFYKDLSVADLENIFNDTISYCFIEYLKNPEYFGKERMAVCHFCNCIFSKSKLNGHQLYCPVCSRKNKMTPKERADYQKTYRANPTQIKNLAKRKREKSIQYLMTNAGKTRKDAEIITDSEM